MRLTEMAGLNVASWAVDQLPGHTVPIMRRFSAGSRCSQR